MGLFWKRSGSATTAEPKADRYGDPLPAGAVGRLGTNRLQHVTDRGNEGVAAVAFSPDGQALAAAGREDGRISIFEAATGRLQRVLGRQPGEIVSLAFAPDGRLLAAGDRGGAVWLWDVHTGTKVGQVKGDNFAVYGLAFAPRGNLWAAAGFCGVVTVWEVGRPRRLLELRSPKAGEDLEEDNYYAVAIAPDGSRLAAASSYRFRGEELPADKLDLFFPGCPDIMEAM